MLICKCSHIHAYIIHTYVQAYILACHVVTYSIYEKPFSAKYAKNIHSRMLNSNNTFGQINSVHYKCSSVRLPVRPSLCLGQLTRTWYMDLLNREFSIYYSIIKYFIVRSFDRKKKPTYPLNNTDDMTDPL